MEPVSVSITENATKKRSKVHRSRPEIVRKVIAFQEIVNLTHNKRSCREAAHFLEVPNATMQFWMKRDNNNEALGQFFSTPPGADFLQRNVMAVMKLMKCGPCGIRGMQEYLLNSGLSYFVASSEGALQDFWKRCEDYILAFGEHEEKRLAVRMSHKKITAGLDEMFRGRRPCLVAIEVVSNYILVEKFTSDRKEETWNKELHDRIQGLNVTIVQVVSDLCGAIRACAKKFSAEHIPELFHAQHEICKAVSAPLASQARAAEQAASKAEEKIKKLSQKPLRLIKAERKQQECELKEAINNHNQLKIEGETKRERQAAVSSAIKEMGNIHHPIDLKTGKLQTAATMQKRFNGQFQLIEKRAQAARLTQSSIERIAKAKRAFDGIINYIERFFIFYSAFLVGLQLTSVQENFFHDVIFPFMYLKMIWRRLPKKTKIELQSLWKNLETRIRDAPWSEELKGEWMIKGKEVAERFQRSSSCVEGRNGALSLNHHRFHRLNERSLKALTIMHNFDARRPDGTTAAERFFGTRHENLFESLVKRVVIPGRPQLQYHNRKARLAA